MKTPTRFRAMLLSIAMLCLPTTLRAQDEEVSILTLEAPVSDAVESRKKIPIVEVSVVSSQIDVPLENEAAGAAELVRTRHPDGTISVERWVVEDAKGNLVNHGGYVAFDAKGAQIVQGNYVMGKRDGQWQKQISVEQAQQLSPTLDKGFATPFVSTANFKADKLDGEWMVADGRGNIVLSWNYSAGERNGPSNHFDSAGKITQSINYVRNLADGPAKLSADAKMQNFVQGKVATVMEKFYPQPEVNGKSKSKATAKQLQSQESVLVPSAFNVESSDWDQCRIEMQKLSDSRPILQGRVITFYENGMRKSEGSYENNKKNGTFAWWHSNGQQQTVGEFRNDKQHSSWTWWHANGMKEAVGEFNEGIKINEWSVWNAEGKLASRIMAGQPNVANVKNQKADVR